MHRRRAHRLWRDESVRGGTGCEHYRVSELPASFDEIKGR